MKKKRKTNRDQFVGAFVSKETKLEIMKEAEKRDTSMSRVVAEVLNKAFKSENESVQTSAAGD